MAFQRVILNISKNSPRATVGERNIYFNHFVVISIIKNNKFCEFFIDDKKWAIKFVPSITDHSRKLTFQKGKGATVCNIAKIIKGKYKLVPINNDLYEFKLLTAN